MKILLWVTLHTLTNQVLLKSFQLKKAHYKVIKGRSLTEADEGKRVIVLESNAVKDLFGER